MEIVEISKDDIIVTSPEEQKTPYIGFGHGGIGNQDASCC